ncbi:unnamed protein product [Prunus armeniaca]
MVAAGGSFNPNDRGGFGEPDPGRMTKVAGCRISIQAQARSRISTQALAGSRTSTQGDWKTTDVRGVGCRTSIQVRTIIRTAEGFSCCRRRRGPCRAHYDPWFANGAIED